MRPSQEYINTLALCNYSSTSELNIKIKDRNRNADNYEVKTLEVILTKPIRIEMEEVQINALKVWTSSCVLPGQDPEGEKFQKCLDNFMHLFDGNSSLFVLFDGHGQYGQEVVTFCCGFTSNFYRIQKPLLNVIFYIVTSCKLFKTLSRRL